MADSTPNQARKPVILVVEEEEGVRQLLKVALGQFGFDVRLASSGREGLALYQKPDVSFDLVLLDVRMNGLDGPQTLARLRQINPDIRCCFMSGDTANNRVEDLLALGAVRVYRKPFQSLGELAQDLHQLAQSIK